MDFPVAGPRGTGAWQLLRSALVVLSTLTLITCAEDPIGPATGEARLRIVPVFESGLRAPPLIIDAVHIRVERPGDVEGVGERVFEDTIQFSPDRDSLRIDDIKITMTQPSEELVILLELLSGTTVLFQGRDTVIVVRGQNNRPATIPLSYTGPGSNVASLVLGPRDTIVDLGATVNFRLDAFDGQGAPVPQYYASWSLTGGPAAGARISADGRLTAPSVRDTFFVKAVNLPTLVADSTRVIVGPPPPITVIPTPLAAGNSHSCEIRGTVTFCWGENGSGGLGDGTTSNRFVPTPVATSQVFVAVSAGTMHTCALTAQGQAFCWGENSGGALGDGTTINRSSPVPVSGNHNFAQIAAANLFTCGITLQGQGFCWGENFTGQLGDGSTNDSPVPVAVVGNHSFVRISAEGIFDGSSDHACAIDAAGLVWCWGANDDGQLGNGSQTDSNSPVRVSGTQTFAEISVGGNSSCGIATTGNGFCWGFNFGVQLTTPQPVAGSFTYTALDMGENHVCGLTSGGWRCGGDNGFGQLGDGTTTDRTSPVIPSGGHNFTAIAAGARHTCGITSGGTFCWGHDNAGQLGTGDVNFTDQLTPTAVMGAPASITLVSGNNQTGAPQATLPNPLVVQVRDAAGAPVMGAEVVFTITAGGGTLSGNTSESITTDASGNATSDPWTLGPAGSNGVSAAVSAAGVTGNPVVFTATGNPSAVTTLVWNGGVSTDWSVAGNWTPAQVPGPLDSAVIGTTVSGRQPTLTTTTVVGAVSIVGNGNLTVGGQGLGTARGLSTGGQGVLTMTNDADVVSVGSNAVFDGGNELNLLSAGGLSIAGNLTQLASNSGDSYHPSGSHITVLAGTNPTVSFATPGLVPGTSHFQELGWVGTGQLTLLTPVAAHGTMVITSQTNAIVSSSNGSRLSLGDLAAAAPVVFNNVPLTISQAAPGTTIALANITFQNMPTTVSQLVVNHPGEAGPFTFTNLVFSSTPVAPNGFYLDAIDPTGPGDGSLTINMVNPTPASGGSFVRTTGNAVVNWPGAAPSLTGTWVGTYTAGGAMSAVLTTEGTTVTGQITDAANCVYDVSGTVSGLNFSLPTWVNVVPGTGFCATASITLTGAMSPDGTTATGDGMTDAAPWTFTWTRQ